MTSTAPDGFRTDPQAEMDPEAYSKWLTSLRDKDGTWREGFRTPALTELSGVTYRQADYWARRGILPPEIYDSDGSGTQRIYSFEDVCRSALLNRLVGTENGWGLSLETAGRAVERIRLSGQQICMSAGVIAPSPNYDGSLTFANEVPKELEAHGFVVMTQHDVLTMATSAMAKAYSLR